MFNLIKKYLFVTFFIFLNCQSVNDYYFGRVLNENNKPIENVIVKEDGFENKTKTDKKGFFKLKRSSNWLGNLIFSKVGYKTDTIPAVWSQNGETIQYNFLDNDTTIVRLKSKAE